MSAANPDALAAAHALLAAIADSPGAAPAPDTALAALERWDSLKAVRLVLQLEGRIGRELSENEIAGLATVGDVARLIAGGPG
jgi:acyl carrier protein